MSTPVIEKVAKHAPRPAQAYRIERILSEPTKAALIGDDMGVGKTLVAIRTIIDAGWKRVLIVGVKDTFGAFAGHLEAQSDGALALRRIDSTKAGRAAFDDLLAGKDGIFFTGSQYLVAQDYDYAPAVDKEGKPIWKTVKRTGEVVTKPNDQETGPQLLPVQETMRTHLKTYRKMRPLDAIIFDEVHVIQNRKSLAKRTIMTVPTKYKVALSGTWHGNKFEGAWGVTRWLWPEHIDASFERWKRQWCATDSVRIKGGEEKTVIVGERNPGEFVKTLPCYIRAEAEEKPPAPELVYVDLSERQREQYQRLEEDLLTWLDSNQGKLPLVADLPITLRSRLRTAALGEMSFSDEGKVSFADDCESSKIRALSGILQADGWAGKQVAIYTDSKEFAHMLGRRMQNAGLATEVWSGSVSSKRRAEIKAAFLAGEFQYLIAVIPAFSTGLDGFQKVCNRVVWMSESENGLLNDQAIARFFRPGRIPDTETDSFQHVKILARETHDVGIYSRLIEQRLRNNATMRQQKGAA